MIRALILAVPLVVATPVAAETRYYAYDAADRLTRGLTNGLTFQVERGLMGGHRVDRLYSTRARGSATLAAGGPDGVRRALPKNASETAVYGIAAEGNGRGLTRALCPGADQAWLVLGRLRPARPLTVQAVGRWSDGAFRPCARLTYSFRGEWALPPGAAAGASDPLAPPTRQ